MSEHGRYVRCDLTLAFAICSSAASTFFANSGEVLAYEGSSVFE